MFGQHMGLGLFVLFLFIVALVPQLCRIEKKKLKACLSKQFEFALEPATN